jgi:hypothetical protein
VTLRFAQLLERLAEVDECPEIEAKRCETELGKSALETISAFSNEPGMGGGYLVCGVEDGTLTGKVVVHGVADAKKLEQEISSVCASVFNRAVRPRVTVERHEGRAVVVAFIPEASPAEKPVFIANRGLQHGTFRRIGSSDQRCTEDDLRVLFRAGDTTPGPAGSAASPERGMAERDRGMAGRDRGMLAEPMRPNDVIDLGDASATTGPDRGELVPDRGMALERRPESLRLLVSGLRSPRSWALTPTSSRSATCLRWWRTGRWSACFPISLATRTKRIAHGKGRCCPRSTTKKMESRR